MRKALFGPAAVAAATLLTVFASVGLHPEPADSGLISSGHPVAHGGRDAARSSDSHDCQICLAHRPVPLSCLQDVVFDRESSVFSPVPETPSLRTLLLPSLSDGRAPPSA